jgi:hypothetical protein
VAFLCCRWPRGLLLPWSAARVGRLLVTPDLGAPDRPPAHQCGQDGGRRPPGRPPAPPPGRHQEIPMQDVSPGSILINLVYFVLGFVAGKGGEGSSHATLLSQWKLIETQPQVALDMPGYAGQFTIPHQAGSCRPVYTCRIVNSFNLSSCLYLSIFTTTRPMYGTS